MKYYAVTEDPNELFHYGVKGMKWGKHLFGDKPKSPGYKRAASKLRASLKSNASKAKAGWKSVSSTLGEKMRKRQETKFENAVKAAQDRVKKNELLFAKNEIKQQEKASKQAYKDLARSQKESAREAKDFKKYKKQIDKIQRMAELSDFKASMKQDSKESKAEKHMDKYMQEAREGRLKYGKLTDEQVGRVTERLALENQARRLGGTENPRFTKDLKSALRQGILSGIASGTSTAMTEVARAKVQNTLGKRTLMKQAKNQAKMQKEQNRIRNKKSHHDIVQEVKQEAYETRVREGAGFFDRNLKNTFRTSHNQAEYLKKLNKEHEDSENRKWLQNEIYKKYVTTMPSGKNLVGDKLEGTLNGMIERYNDDDIYKKVYGKDRNAAKEKKSITDNPTFNYINKKLTKMEQNYEKSRHKSGPRLTLQDFIDISNAPIKYDQNMTNNQPDHTLWDIDPRKHRNGNYMPRHGVKNKDYLNYTPRHGIKE